MIGIFAEFGVDRRRIHRIDGFDAKIEAKNPVSGITVLEDGVECLRSQFLNEVEKE
jgi:hypothetical protein